MSSGLDLRLEIERLPFGRPHLVAVVLLAIATLFDGYDVFVPAYVIPYAIRAWRLVPSEAGLLVSSGLIGFMIGALLNGAFADRIGRKPVLAAALLLAALGNLANATWVDSYPRFLAVRIATGIGLGIILPLAVTLLNELAPSRIANVLLGWVMAGWSIGGVVAALAGIALVPSPGWHALFAVGVLAAPLSALVMVFLPESPRFLAIHGQQDEARAVLARMASTTPERYGGTELSVREDAEHAGSFAQLLAPRVRGRTLTVWACSGLSLFSIFGLSSWTPEIMLERGAAIRTSFALGAVLQLAAVLGGLGCGWAADRSSRDRTLIASWAVGAAAVIGLALVAEPRLDIGFLAIAGFCVMGAQPVLNNLTAALYETRIRSSGVGAQLGVGRLGGILGPYIGGWLQQLFPGSAALFLFMACALASCALLIRRLERSARTQVAPSAE
ncbi:MAG TPA: MFS transporter [Steroidobacteraceae bacterium]|nr:MFS transporter [Steroidobacteraceae bacterium]